MRKKIKPSRKSCITRARINRAMEETELKAFELAQLMGIPESTMYGYVNTSVNKKYPRDKRCDELNAVMDELKIGKPPKRIERPVVELPAATPDVVEPVQAELPLDGSDVAHEFEVELLPEVSAVVPVKPHTTEQELRWIVEGYRCEAIQGLGDEVHYVLAQYRKQGGGQ